MQNISSLRLLTRFYSQSHKTKSAKSPYIFGYEQKHTDAGFSLIEVVAVVLMIGILAAIALPSWSAFVNRQRLNKANDAVLAAIQQAQTEAKKKKLSYSVSFQKNSTTQAVEFAIYGTKKNDGTNLTTAEITTWKPLGEDLGVDAKQLEVGANLTSENTAGTSVSALSTPAKITFDYLGVLPNANFGTAVAPSTEPPGLKIVLAPAPPKGSVSSSSNGLKRCVIVNTILGSTLTKKDSDCK